MTARPARRVRRFTGSCLALAALMGGACGAGEPSSSGADDDAAVLAEADAAAARVPGANLVLISIDTLRSDRLGCYGYTRPTSPAIDALAARGVRFARMISESSWTLPAHVTMMTGLHPGTHGVNLSRSEIPETVPMLAEILRKNGFTTHGLVGGGHVSERHGFGRGFDSYEVRKRGGLGRTLRQARGLIEGLRQDDRFFLFVHTYDVHCPYDPAAPVAAAFETRPPEDHVETKGRCGNPHFNSMDLTKGQASYLSDRYDAGIRAADEELGEFFRFLERRSEAEDTVIALVSDHGEEFLEHGQIGHERTLYIESLLIPWIVVSPGLAPKVVRGGTSLVDVLPTLLDLLDIEGPGVEGRSRLQVMSSAHAADLDRPLYSHLQRELRLRSVIVGDEHLIVDRESKKRLLFDLSTDPLEQHDLAGLDGARADRAAASFAARPTVESTPESGTVRRLSPEELEQLRSLGYFE